MLRTRVLTGLIAIVVLAAASAVVRAQDPQPKKAPAAPTAAAPLNLNTATAAQLETLPGIGPALAARILEQRQKAGGFKKVEELMNVKGIGEKAFLKIKPLVTVTPPKTVEKGIEAVDARVR
jgi:competence protein ComEA